MIEPKDPEQDNTVVIDLPYWPSKHAWLRRVAYEAETVTLIISSKEKGRWQEEFYVTEITPTSNTVQGMRGRMTLKPVKYPESYPESVPEYQDIPPRETEEVPGYLQRIINMQFSHNRHLNKIHETLIRIETALRGGVVK